MTRGTRRVAQPAGGPVGCAAALRGEHALRHELAAELFLLADAIAPPRPTPLTYALAEGLPDD